MMRSLATAVSLLLLAACARSEDASTLPSDTNGLAVPVEQVRPTASLAEHRSRLVDIGASVAHRP